MELTEIQLRYKLLQLVYRGAAEKNSDTYRFVPELLGCTYSEINYQLRYMKSKGLLDYTPRMLMRSYTVTILPPGRQVVDGFEAAFHSTDDPDRDERMKEALAPLK